MSDYLQNWKIIMTIFGNQLNAIGVDLFRALEKKKKKDISKFA